MISFSQLFGELAKKHTKVNVHLKNGIILSGTLNSVDDHLGI